MSLAWLLMVLIAVLLTRLTFLAVHWSNLEGLWYDFERRGLLYRLAIAIDWVTFLVYLLCALRAVWHLQDRAPTLLGKCGIVFVAWFGVLLIERLAIHRFPRTNHPQRYSEAKISLIAHLVTASVGALAFTGLAAIWYGLRG